MTLERAIEILEAYKAFRIRPNNGFEIPTYHYMS